MYNLFMYRKYNTPLPEKIRPRNLSEFVGQEHLVGKNGIIKNLIENTKESNFFPSLILWGPPGSGKTTLARIIASELKREFYEFSAVNTKTKEIENIINDKKGKRTEKLKNQQELISNHPPNTIHQPLASTHHPPIIFIDEIHRFNKAQQDKLLPYVERGDIILIGATTENPSFEVIRPLMSRCRVLILNRLSEKNLQVILKRGLKELRKQNSGKQIKISEEAKNFLIESSNGDARVLLNVLEIAKNLTNKATLTIENIETALQRKQLFFDKKGDEYYDVISAYIKSMRAGDVDAALYYLARMIEAGQDPLYIARRMVVFASEDVASPTALVVANAVFQACDQVGLPECQENLAAGTVYLATAKKDRSAYEAYMKALEDVHKFGNLPVPLKIRNPVTKLMEQIGYGKGYEKYTKESLLPEKLKGKKYYHKEKEEGKNRNTGY